MAPKKIQAPLCAQGDKRPSVTCFGLLCNHIQAAVVFISSHEVQSICMRSQIDPMFSQELWVLADHINPPSRTNSQDVFNLMCFLIILNITVHILFSLSSPPTPTHTKDLLWLSLRPKLNVLVNPSFPALEGVHLKVSFPLNHTCTCSFTTLLFICLHLFHKMRKQFEKMKVKPIACQHIMLVFIFCLHSSPLPSVRLKVLIDSLL